MIRLIPILISLLCLLLGLTSRAQDPFAGSNPAVTNRNLEPVPLANVGSPFSITFTLGNHGQTPISGADMANRMGFTICLSKCALTSTNLLASVTGEAREYFDLTLNPTTGCLNGLQNQGKPIADRYNLELSLVVTQPSSYTGSNNIGAACTIIPNSAASLQPTEDDFADIYSHTISFPLPVSLVSFTVQAQSNQTVLLNWKTAWEQTNKGYFIERSKDLVSFELVGGVADVAGNSNNVSLNRFVDPTPYRGTSYYRLRQVDLDGTSHTFAASPVVIDGSYRLFPNPLTSRVLTLELDEPLNAVMHLYNSSGLEIGLERKSVSDQQVKLISLAEMAPGIYVLTVTERGTTRSYRLLVQ